MVDQSGRDLVLLKQLIDAVIELVGNERKTKSFVLVRLYTAALLWPVLDNPMFRISVVLQFRRHSVKRVLFVFSCRGHVGAFDLILDHGFLHQCRLVGAEIQDDPFVCSFREKSPLEVACLINLGSHVQNRQKTVIL